jgi:hypothetical protein
MKRVTIIATALFVAVLAALTINVRAQDFNPLEKTYLTFSAPVELPGMTLPAGTYTFKLADTPSRNVVQVMSQDEQKIHGQFLFVQAQRRDATGETVVTFKETAEGTTPAVQYWYYPGESIGKEFVYPKDQAMKIAARTHSTVLSTDGEIGPDSQVSSIDESGKVTVWERQNSQNTQNSSGAPAEPAVSANASAPAQPTAAAGSLAGNRGVQQERESVTRDTTIAQDTPAPAPAQSPASAPARQPSPVGTSGQAPVNELPRTASPLPIAGLLGLLSLAGGLGIRAFRL